MKNNFKYILLLIVCLTELQMIAQTKEECHQFELIIKYLENDSSVEKPMKVTTQNRVKLTTSTGRS